MRPYDFIILGGGIAGVSVAAELAAEARVLVIEREASLAYHSTGRSAAMHLETYGPPLIRTLARQSRDFFTAPPAEARGVDLSRPRDSLIIAAAGREDRLRDLALEYGATVGEVIDATTCVRLVPILRETSLCGAYREFGALDLDVDAVHQTFLRQARDRGAEIVAGAGAPRFSRVGELWSAELDQGTVQGRVIINAAGAWADDLAADLGAARIGLSPLRRTVVLVDPPEGQGCSGWPSVMDADDQFYFKPDAGKLLLSPADETPSTPCDAQPDEMDIAIAVDRVQRVADLPVRRINHAWAGLRTFAPDGLPVVGYDPVIPGLFWLAGQGGYGIQTSPALSRLAAGLALGEGAPGDLYAAGIDAAALDPGRPQPAVASH